jgi:hypothetical protein
MGFVEMLSSSAQRRSVFDAIALKGLPPRCSELFFDQWIGVSGLGKVHAITAKCYCAGCSLNGEVGFDAMKSSSLAGMK